MAVISGNLRISCLMSDAAAHTSIQTVLLSFSTLLLMSKQHRLCGSYSNSVTIYFHSIHFPVGSQCWLKVHQTLFGPQLTCVWGGGDQNLMRSPAPESCLQNASKMSSAFSRTLSACGAKRKAGSVSCELDYRKLEEDFL